MSTNSVLSPQVPHDDNAPISPQSGRRTERSPDDARHADCRQPGLWQTLLRSGRLRCPACGDGTVARNWRATEDRCPACGFDCQVEGGFYLGSIYLNYGVMAIVGLAVGMPVVALGYVSPTTAIATALVIGIPFSLWFFRYARSLWLGLAYYLDHNVRIQVPSRLAEPAGQSKERATTTNAVADTLRGICYFCHQRFEFAETKLQTWDTCPCCHESILLTRLPEPTDEEKECESTGSDSACAAEH